MAKASIVLVEDNSFDVKLIQEALAEHGVDHNLTVLKNGEKAIEYIEEIDRRTCAAPRLLILDLNLPRKSGREVLRRARLSPYCAGIPVVILSSSDTAKDREEAQALGATHYIRKPSDLDLFLKIGATLKGIVDQSLY